MGSLVSAGADKEDREFPQVLRRTLCHEGCTRSYCDSFKPIVTLLFQFLDLSPPELLSSNGRTDPQQVGVTFIVYYESTFGLHMAEITHQSTLQAAGTHL